MRCPMCAEEFTSDPEVIAHNCKFYVKAYQVNPPSQESQETAKASIQHTLAEWDKEYGLFRVRAEIAQDIKDILYTSPNWGDLDRDMREALDMIAHKIARILNGNPFNIDSWHDIAGYATLVADRVRSDDK